MWVVSMSSPISEDKFWNLFPVSTLVEFTFTIGLLLIFLLFLGVDDDFAGELLRILVFLFPLDSFVVVFFPLPKPRRRCYNRRKSGSVKERWLRPNPGCWRLTIY